jgi:hypothetical protein
MTDGLSAPRGKTRLEVWASFRTASSLKTWGKPLQPHQHCICQGHKISRAASPTVRPMSKPNGTTSCYQADSVDRAPITAARPNRIQRLPLKNRPAVDLRPGSDQPPSSEVLCADSREGQALSLSLRRYPARVEIRPRSGPSLIKRLAVPSVWSVLTAASHLKHRACRSLISVGKTPQTRSLPQ